MNCSRIRKQLDDYLDGELTGSTQKELERHLTDCTDCQREYESLRSLVERARSLAPELPLSRDLWPALHDRIDNQRPFGSSSWLQWAAAALALAVLAIPFSAWWLGRSAPESSTAVGIETEEPSLEVRAERARSEDGVQLARTDLVTAIERHRGVLEADDLQGWQDSMTVLDRAIGELQAALEEDPQNLRLRMLLASRYQQERKLLQKVSRV